MSLQLPFEPPTRLLVRSARSDPRRKLGKNRNPPGIAVQLPLVGAGRMHCVHAFFLLPRGFPRQPTAERVVDRTSYTAHLAIASIIAMPFPQDYDATHGILFAATFAPCPDKFRLVQSCTGRWTSPWKANMPANLARQRSPALPSFFVR